MMPYWLFCSLSISDTLGSPCKPDIRSCCRAEICGRHSSGRVGEAATHVWIRYHICPRCCKRLQTSHLQVSILTNHIMLLDVMKHANHVLLYEACHNVAFALFCSV